MFNYLLKSIPAEFAFAGYNVRKSLSILTQEIDGQIVYDVFLYTYIDNSLSFYILMDDGMYKNVSLNKKITPVDGMEMVSKHLFRGEYYDVSDYEIYDKDEVMGVFGLRSINDLIKQTDAKTKEISNNEMSMEALIDIKKAYTGLEISGVIGRFNKLKKDEKKEIMVPAIKYGPEDTYRSLIGDEFDFFDFMSNKDSDVIIDDLLKLNDTLDGVGNVK